jgi:hypothetical protein
VSLCHIPTGEGITGHVITVDSHAVPAHQAHGDALTYADRNLPDGSTVCVSDRDGDGFADDEDAFPDDPTEWADNDGDGVGDNADTDDDNDGQSDEDETACGSDPLSANSQAPDSDGDNLPDCVDPDDDNDGVPDDLDICPGFDDNIDTDGDGVPDGCDITTGQITIVKSANPADDTPFDFTGDLGDFSLRDPNATTQTFEVDPGQYAVTELPLSGWELSSISCSFDAGSNATLDLQTRTATIDLGVRGDVTCTFSNSETIGSITIVKSANPADDTPFDFTGDLGDFSLSDPNATTQTFEVVPGQYAVTELPLSGWELSSISCSFDAGSNATLDLQTRTATIDLGVRGDVSCTYSNTQVP